MNNRILCLSACAAMIAGCGPSPATDGRAQYPALNASPPPPAPPPPDTASLPMPVRVQADPDAPPPAVIREDSWSQRQMEKEEMVKALRKYAAEADKDDPFALTEERIQALASREDVILN